MIFPQERPILGDPRRRYTALVAITEDAALVEELKAASPIFLEAHPAQAAVKKRAKQAHRFRWWASR